MRKLLLISVGSTRGSAWGAILLLRLWVGGVFILAGFRKFAEPETMGTGRFADMGLPYPEFLGPWVGFWEITGGLLVLAGLLTRAGAIPLIVIMIVAIWTTKVPELQQSLVQGLHAARLDVALLVTCVYLLIAGSGRFALDRLLERRLASSRGW